MVELDIREALLKAVQIREQVAAEMMQLRNVVACGVGFKLQNGKVTSTPCVSVSVREKMSRDRLRPQDMIPGLVSNIPTDVIETGEIIAHSLDRQSRQRPIRPGVSIGHQNSSAGTLGCIVKRDGNQYLLSNNHVLALLNKAQPGDAVLQPGPGDGGSLLDQVALLSDYVELEFRSSIDAQTFSQAAEKSGCAPLIASVLALLGKTDVQDPPDTGSEPENTVDAALAQPLDGIAIDPRIIDIGGLPLGVGEPELGMRIIKSGRTSGLTQGIIQQIDVTVDVRYGEQVARFKNQILTNPISEPGDSGSLVLDYQRNAIGLLFAGSRLVSIVNPIQLVLDAFGVELVLE